MPRVLGSKYMINAERFSNTDFAIILALWLLENVYVPEASGRAESINDYETRFSRSYYLLNVALVYGALEDSQLGLFVASIQGPQMSLPNVSLEHRPCLGFHFSCSAVSGRSCQQFRSSFCCGQVWKFQRYLPAGRSELYSNFTRICCFSLECHWNTTRSVLDFH